MEKTELNLTYLEEVWTKDDRKLGRAYRLFHRTKDIDPELRLYASYLKIISFTIGEDYYVPTDYIARAPDTGKLTVQATLRQVLEETWERMPDFIAQGLAQEEVLPSR